MNTADPLAQLRDIHLPEPVGWWPPAPGWWIVFLAALIAVFLGIFVVRKHWLQNRYRKVALRELRELAWKDESDKQALLAEMSALLRRVAIQTSGRKSVAPLSGQSWLSFLDRTGNTHQFSQGPAKILGNGIYQASVEADMDQVRQIVQNWIKGHRK